MTKSNFAIAKCPLPLLNAPDFASIFGGEDGSSLPLDAQGLLRSVETIALKGTKFEILEKYGPYVCRVFTRDYPHQSLFADCRFFEEATIATPERSYVIPSQEILLRRLHSLEGTAYVWGGNWSFGIPEMLHFYPPRKPLESSLEMIWSLKGIDCSGLLYQVCNGAIPRNTAELLFWGNSLSLGAAGLSTLVEQLKPLDLIVWKGHVVIVLDKETVIESRAGLGVIKTPLAKRLEEILREFTLVKEWDPLNEAKQCVIRRWHPDSMRI